MKIALAGIAILAALSSQAMAQTAILNTGVTPSFYDLVDTLDFSNVAAGLYDFSAAITSTAPNTKSGFFVSLLTSAGDSNDFVGTPLPTLTVNTPSAFAYYSIFSGLNLAGGDYSVEIFGAAKGAVTVTATLAPSALSGSISAPGPVAGAGLPLLVALGGFAAWRRMAKDKIQS